MTIRAYTLCFCFMMAFMTTGTAQYEFSHDKDVECTSIKSQANTGTCWSFATASFLESELMRTGKGEHDLSEMYVVRNIYKDKARNYILRQGKANFSQGSLSHDLISVLKSEGVMPENVYSGMVDGVKRHDHSEMEAGLKGFLDGMVKSKKLSKMWPEALESIMDIYLGSVPENFEYGGKKYDPKSFAKSLELDPADYVSVTSFSHHPFGEAFILEIPDNYSNGSYLNVPLDDLIATMDQAVSNGYTVAWDGDVSEKGFDAKHGIAVLPMKPNRKDLFEKPGPEVKVTQELRQQLFESLATTDDHLMHIVGTAKDQNGNEYYLVKNSWGKVGPHDGYLYMSKAYAAMKTVSIMVHKDVMSL